MSEKFNYTYSAREQAEMEEIRRKYITPEQKPDKLELMRKLDKKAEMTGTISAICIGLFGTMLLGIGLSLILEFDNFITGIVLGLFGMGIMALAYPAFRKITELQRKKVAPEILRLSEEIKNGF